MRVSARTERRLKRLRWQLTALFAVALVVCLAVLGTLALVVDSRAHSRAVDSELNRRATGLSRAVWIDESGLHLDPLSEDPLVNGTAEVVVVELVASGPAQRRYTGAVAAALPTDVELGRVAGAVAEREQTVVETAKTGAGRAVRLAAAPVWGKDLVRAVVIVAGDPGIDGGSRKLVLWSIAGCALLAALAIGAGQLAARSRIRPVIELLNRQERFLADAAHELRTPLTTLRLVAEAGTRSPPQGQQALHDTIRLADQLGRQVGGLLARARVQAGTEGIERLPLRLDQLVEQVVDDLPPNDATVRVHTEPTVVHGDPDLLTQAVRNLLDNAVTHGAYPDRPAWVNIRVADSRVAIQDAGPGIAGGLGQRAFEWGTAGPGGGTGIGLAIVRWIADEHHATVRIDPLPDGGSVAELVFHAQEVTPAGKV